MQPVDGILVFHFPILLGVIQVLLSPDAGSSIDSWADQAWGEIKTTESPIAELETPPSE